MTQREKANSAPDHYRIRLHGQLGSQWKEWFEDMTITNRGDETWLTGPVTDQSALHGLLNRIRDLNLVLIGLERIKSAGGPK